MLFEKASPFPLEMESAGFLDFLSKIISCQLQLSMAVVIITTTSTTTTTITIIVNYISCFSSFICKILLLFQRSQTQTLFFYSEIKAKIEYHIIQMTGFHVLCFLNYQT